MFLFHKSVANLIQRHLHDYFCMAVCLPAKIQYKMKFFAFSFFKQTCQSNYVGGGKKTSCCSVLVRPTQISLGKLHVHELMRKPKQAVGSEKAENTRKTMTESSEQCPL